MKKLKKFKQKLEYFKSDLEFLEDRIRTLEAAKRQTKRNQILAVRIFIIFLFTCLLLTYFYSVFFK